MLGRPASINTGSAGELPTDRSVGSYREHTAAMLDAARADAVELGPDELAGLVDELAMDPADYWRERSALTWH